jgi:hypothetical protein
VDVPARVRDWQRWTNYCNNQGQEDPFLATRTDAERSAILVGFAARCRSGLFGKGIRIKSATVAAALRNVGQMFELSGWPDPRKPTGGKELHLTITRQLKSYAHEDPSTESQIALPLKIFQDISDHEGMSAIPVEQATSDVITIMFYFLLRVGEITCPEGTKVRRTVQFRRRDTKFWKKTPDGRLVRLADDTPLAQLLEADEVTLTLTNQKNGTRDSTLHHERVPGTLCPVKAVARRYDASRRADPTNESAMLCLYSPQSFVLSRHVNQALKRAAFRTSIWLEGFEIRRIGPHSIRASGAMALYLNGVKEENICLLGRWKSKTWLTYIHTQIAAVTAGLSRAMSRPIVFHNIAVPT